MRETNLKVDCPTCKKKVSWTEDYPERPFCSERCKLIDLGAWADESYRIASEEVMDWPEDASTNPTLQ